MEECFKVNLFKIKIELCKKEVLNMLKESKVDIFVDLVFYIVCVLDIKYYCVVIIFGCGC